MNPAGDRRTGAAEQDAARFPPLLVEADRVATAVSGGVHGRRRPGQGDSFWEYRPLRHGEAASRIDWRRSARDGRLFVRETEWEAAQTVCLWRDRSPRMAWRSDPAHPTKGERADLILLALASLLLRGGERPRLLGAEGLGPVHTGPSALASLAASLPPAPSAADRPGATGKPFDAVPPHAAVVLFGDGLDPLPELEARLARLAGRPSSGVFVQVLDPAERRFPFRGRVRFREVGGVGEMLASRAETLRDSYTARLAAHEDALGKLCTEAGFRLIVHGTGAPPATALLALHQALGRSFAAGGTDRLA